MGSQTHGLNLYIARTMPTAEVHMELHCHSHGLFSLDGDCFCNHVDGKHGWRHLSPARVICIEAVLFPGSPVTYVIDVLQPVLLNVLQAVLLNVRQPIHLCCAALCAIVCAAA